MSQLFAMRCRTSSVGSRLGLGSAKGGGGHTMCSSQTMALHALKARSHKGKLATSACLNTLRKLTKLNSKRGQSGHATWTQDGVVAPAPALVNDTGGPAVPAATHRTHLSHRPISVQLHRHRTRADQETLGW